MQIPVGADIIKLLHCRIGKISGIKASKLLSVCLVYYLLPVIIRGYYYPSGLKLWELVL